MADICETVSVYLQRQNTEVECVTSGGFGFGPLLGTTRTSFKAG